MKIRQLLLAATAALAAFASADVNLRFVVWDGDVATQVLREEIGRFEKAHPGIHVKFETVTTNYQEKLLAQVAAHVAPDVAMMDPANFQRFASRGALLELNPLFRYTPGFDLSEYYKNLVDAHSLKGKLYVLPRDIAPCAIVYYNKKLFREAGIPYPDGTWTYDFKERPELKDKDFLWVMHRLTMQKGKELPERWGYAPGWKDLWKEMTFLQMGARVVDNYESPTKLLFDDPRIIRATQFTADLSLKQRWMPSDTEITNVLQSNTRQMFTQQKVAMLQSGIWEVPELRKELKPGTPGYFDWDIAIAPVLAGGKRAYPTGGSGYCILKETLHPREAWLLTQWMAGEPGMMAMARAGIAQPGIRKLALREPWIPGPHTPAEQQVPHNRIITDQAAPYVVFSPTSVYWSEVSGIAGQKNEQVYRGEMTAEAALKETNARAQARLDTLIREQNLPLYNWRWGSLVGLVLIGALGTWIYAPERGKRRSLRQKRDNLAGYLFVLPCLLGMLIFTAGPMVLSLLMSFSEWDIVRPAHWRGLGNYVEAATIDPTFWKALQVTFVYTLVAVPLGVMGSLGLAMLLNTKVKGMPLWRTCYYIPSLASAVASALIWKKVFQVDGGILNSIIYGADGKGNFLGLASLLAPLADSSGRINWLGSEKTALASLIIMSLWGIGGGMVILLAGLQNVPQYLYEAATLDGAGPLKRFRNVTLPMVSPTLFFALVTGFIGSFQVFNSALLMTDGGPNMSTTFFMLHLYKQAFLSLRMGYASALAWVLFFVILIFTVLQLRMSRWVYYEGAK
jgi:multiple sugar transport system permease protein